MATLPEARGRRGSTPWGWFIGLIVIALATVAIIWWTRAGSPGVGTTGQEEVEMRAAPAADQPGAQPPSGGATGADPAGPAPAAQPRE